MKTALLTFSALALSALGFGQGLTGSISGSVGDSSGSSAPAVPVKLTNVQTSQVRQTVTESNGDFVFTQLLPGTFRLEVAAPGFKRYEQNQILVTATERVVLKRVELQVGEITQTIEVKAETARLQTQSAERSGLISQDQTQNVPLKGRDYLGLVKLLPGVIDTANRNAPGWNNLGGITINGNQIGRAHV